MSNSLRHLATIIRHGRQTALNHALFLICALLLLPLPLLAAEQSPPPQSLLSWSLGLCTLLAILAFGYERKRNRKLNNQLALTSACLAEARQQQSKQHQNLATLLEALPTPVYSKDALGRYLSCNQAFCDFMQQSRGQIIGRTCLDLLPEELAEIHNQADQQLTQGLNKICYQASLPHSSGSREVLFNKAALLGPDGMLLEIWGVMTDISDLTNSQIFLSNILNAISYPVFVKDDQSRYQLVNQALNDFVGYSKEEMLGKTDFDLYRNREAERFQTTDLLALQAQDAISYESTITSRTGQSARIDVRKKAFTDKSGNSYLVGVYHDVSKLYRAQEKMVSLQNLLYNIIDSMPSLIIAIDMLGQITQWNHRAEEISGIKTEDAIGRWLNPVFPHHADLEPLINRALETAQNQRQPKVCWQVGEKQHYVDIIVYPLSGGGLEGVVIRADNIDERVRMEEMMIFTEKMVSIGSLAAGMAHEINNPLAIMIQNAQVLRNRLQRKQPKNEQVADDCGFRFEQIQQYLEARNISETLETILQSGSRATRIVEDMVNFAQRRVSCFSPCKIHQLVEQTIELARNDFDLKKKYGFREIEIELDVPADLPIIHCERDQIQQVLLNLLRNGAQSMTENPQQNRPGKFIIRGRAGDEFLQLDVIDNGPGIAKKIQKQIFDPFFTTRPVGTGTGLGLAASYFIVTEKHGGIISLKSEPGAGCHFSIKLPLKGIRHDT